MDQDISTRLKDICLSESPEYTNLLQLSNQLRSILHSSDDDTHHKLYIYGCGASGRLAKQIESETWRQHCPREELRDKVIGELTGGDRALVSALEGFEDLEVIGELQL